ncbi:hypothetical protein HPP92_015838 [Vanilla planifolia]|uniref:Uncharacterized protein n=1 Tax=Vanilla planifolia TaxID=51239 RepID=A0A835UW64_VANPL|nr:hypothetical protein HPP92_015838 [Vanilla planifolia]
MTMFVPGSELPVWLVCYLPMAMSFVNTCMAPGSFSLLLPHLLFENTMSMTKFSAMLSGLLPAGSLHEWGQTRKKLVGR